MKADEVLPGLLVLKNPVKTLEWTVVHEASNSYVFGNCPTKALALELARRLDQWDWTMEADELRAHPQLHVAVFETQLLASGDKVRREREATERAKGKAAEKRAEQPDIAGWDKNMRVMQARTQAEKERRKRWAKKNRRR